MNICACGCGQQVAKEQSWVPGHDHRAIHERIKRDHGNVAGFIEWYDAVYAKKQKAAATRLARGGGAKRAGRRAGDAAQTMIE